MHVLHYHPRAAVGDGGISRSLRALSRALIALGVQVTIAYDQPGPYPVPGDGIRWLPIPHRGPARARFPVGVEEHLCGVDVVTFHSAWTFHNARAARAASAAGVPYVLAPRGAYDPAIRARHRQRRRLWWHAVERPVLTQARAAHVFFAEQGAHLRTLGFRGPLIVAPNGVQIPPQVRWDGGSHGSVLYLGRYDPEHKGLDVLVRALALLDPVRRPRLRLHGSDWQGGKRTVTALVTKLGLEPWIDIGEHLSGDEKWQALAGARILVYPSRWEGFGNSVAEAAAAGVPILATPYPLASYLAARGAAILADPTPQGIAAKLTYLLDRPNDALSQRGIDVARRTFAWSAVAARWRDRLEHVL